MDGPLFCFMLIKMNDSKSQTSKHLEVRSRVNDISL